jgi:phospholipid/cholesterol/gamma-HCH transport system ATP-binding protein
MKVLQLEKVSVRFDENQVLEDINLEISKGESFVILGPSGQGKSVLLKTLAGLVTQLRVELWSWVGAGLICLAPSVLNILKKLGMLFQKNALFDSLSCSENIAFHCERLRI